MISLAFELGALSAAITALVKLWSGKPSLSAAIVVVALMLAAKWSDEMKVKL